MTLPYLNYVTDTDKENAISLEDFNLNSFYQIEDNRLNGWKEIHGIINANRTSDYIIIYREKKVLIDYISTKSFQQVLQAAIAKQVELLIGHASWFYFPVQVHDNLFFCQDFLGFDFVIILQPFFDRIINDEFDEGCYVDQKLSKLSNKKLLLYPSFLSKTDKLRKVENLGTSETRTRGFELVLDSLSKIREHFRKIDRDCINNIDDEVLKNLTIPTYIINLKDRTERFHHANTQFRNKNEFDVRIVEGCKHSIGAVGLWHSIRKVIGLALENDEDVILICEDDHMFTEHYSKEHLFNSIIQSDIEGADLLLGGIGGFGQAVRITNGKFWIDNFFSTQFMIIYKRLFKAILDAPFDETVTADELLSKLTQNKMVLFPFISIQKEFGYSDVTQHNVGKGTVDLLFRDTADRFRLIERIVDIFS